MWNASMTLLLVIIWGALHAVSWSTPFEYPHDTYRFEGELFYNLPAKSKLKFLRGVSQQLSYNKKVLVPDGLDLDEAREMLAELDPSRDYEWRVASVLLESSDLTRADLGPGYREELERLRVSEEKADRDLSLRMMDYQIIDYDYDDALAEMLRTYPGDAPNGLLFGRMKKLGGEASIAAMQEYRSTDRLRFVENLTLAYWIDEALLPMYIRSGVEKWPEEVAQISTRMDAYLMSGNHLLVGNVVRFLEEGHLSDSKERLVALKASLEAGERFREDVRPRLLRDIDEALEKLESS